MLGSPGTVSNEFVLWSDMCLLWSIAAYGISADPLPSDSDSFNWNKWRWYFGARCLGAASLTLLLSRSAILTAWVLLVTVAQPLIRFMTSAKATAALEVSTSVGAVSGILIIVRRCHVEARWGGATFPVTSEHWCALVLTASILLYITRAGTYLVRGCLAIVGTLPLRADSETVISTPEPTAMLPIAIARNQATNADETEHTSSFAASSPAPVVSVSMTAATNGVDEVEINRGRLIGILERLVLTFVVAAGSYAALGFLIAAKGLIRSEDLQKREFAEYFLVGSLASVLIALCAGLMLRYALVALWPQLLSLQMQAS